MDVSILQLPERDRGLKLIEEKDRLETEIRKRIVIIESNQVDVDTFRHARHQLLGLLNDHEIIVKLIEPDRTEVHADLPGSNGEGPVHAPATSSNSHVANGHLANGHVPHSHVANGSMANGSRGSGGDGVAREPFAVVTIVDDGSPADLAGLRTHDEILQFGSITYTNYENFNQIYSIICYSIRQPINVQVKRGNNVVNINLVPRPWAQTRLLGCYIQTIY